MLGLKHREQLSGKTLAAHTIRHFDPPQGRMCDSPLGADRSVNHRPETPARLNAEIYPAAGVKTFRDCDAVNNHPIRLG
ncbi:hypothetical protein NZK35_17855 [Stieleria sp. ICT_E10.1]|uniref:hypothetical protein n=1 Tax=Stieleria sedimenti TaxID=2976331 RepID=UPI00217F96F8|nr:hypothetical protein [Stieleria sedimenti]MCS7468521.1 hypothetical protein [Stieleria sedimenti]